jgi:hypothetical protein
VIRDPLDESRGRLTPPLRKDGEGAYEQVRELTPIASNGPGIRGSTHGYTSWICTERRRVSIRAHGTTEAG